MATTRNLEIYILLTFIFSLIQSVVCECGDGYDDCDTNFSSYWFVWFIVVITLIICCGSIGAYRRRMQLQRLKTAQNNAIILVTTQNQHPHQQHGTVVTPHLTNPQGLPYANAGFVPGFAAPPSGQQNMPYYTPPPTAPMSPPPYTPPTAPPNEPPPNYEDALATDSKTSHPVV